MPGQTVVPVPEAIAVRSPAVDAMLIQVGARMTQATRTGVADPQAQSPKDVTQSVKDWVKSVQKGVQVRLGEAAKSLGKTADSLRSVATATAASPNLATEGIASGSHDIDPSVGEGAASDELDLE
jgi:hypothetical protein